MIPVTENLYDTLRPLLLKYLNAFRVRSEVEGIVVLGGAAASSSRRFLDRFSDLDAALFISIPAAAGVASTSIRGFLDTHQELLPTWLPRFSASIPCSVHPEGEVELNVHQLVMELELAPGREWDEMKKEVYTEAAEIVYDPRGSVESLIATRTAWSEPQARRDLLRVLGQARWYGVTNPRIQVARGFPWHAHDLLNEAIDLIVGAVYLMNRRYRPHKKWRLNSCFELPLLPVGFRDQVLEALVVDDLGPRSVAVRVATVEKLLTAVTDVARNVYDLPDDCYAASVIESFEDRQLLHLSGPQAADVSDIC